jgi:hypothetical protein
MAFVEFKGDDKEDEEKSETSIVDVNSSQEVGRRTNDSLDVLEDGANGGHFEAVRDVRCVKESRGGD